MKLLLGQFLENLRISYFLINNTKNISFSVWWLFEFCLSVSSEIFMVNVFVVCTNFASFLFLIMKRRLGSCFLHRNVIFLIENYKFRVKISMYVVAAVAVGIACNQQQQHHWATNNKHFIATNTSHLFIFLFLVFLKSPQAKTKKKCKTVNLAKCNKNHLPYNKYIELNDYFLFSWQFQNDSKHCLSVK